MKLCYHCMNQIEEKLHICPYCGKSLEEESMSAKYLKPGTVLQNKFIVGYPLGAGGFGNTYIGWNKLLLRKVAIKEFYPEQYVTRAEDGVMVTVNTDNLQPRFRNGLQQFLEEARSVASLQDIKGVVEISNFFEENGTGYIIMEYLEGMDVKTILKKSGDKKDYEWCRRVILTLLHTLRDIHKRGVLHRDIAPDNIFVTNEGVIKLIDFGAARHSSALANMKSEVVLKVGYAPIEQYSRNTRQGPYTDLYAVAALFYRMLTGQKPIPANERLQNDTLVTPSQMGIEIPEQAEMGIMVCLNVKPEYRLQSADDFMDILDGKNFIPVYEPKWILPPVEEKKRFSDIPMAAKAGICFAVICMIVGVTVGGVVLVHSNSNNKVELGDSGSDGENMLPDYRGESEEEARESLKELQIENVSVVYELNSEAMGTVIRQNPDPGEISVDEMVTLYVSGGDDKYTLENFIGKDKDYILNWFTKFNFDISENTYPGDELKTVEYEANSQYSKKSGKINLIYEYSDEHACDICYSQSVAAGEICSGSDSITIAVSCGKISDYELAIPDLANKSKKKAEKLLKEAGLDTVLNVKFEDAEEQSDDVKKGNVLEQSILEGYVYNKLENKVYKYVDGKRVDESVGNELVITLSIGSEGMEEKTTTTEEKANRTEEEVPLIDEFYYY